MKITKKIVTAIVLVAFMIGMTGVTGFATDTPTSGTCGENLTWELNGTALTISGYGEMGYGQWGENITSVSLPDGLTSIDDFAFSGCEFLTSVTIPDSVTTIEESAFSRCDSLKSVTIPNSVTTIGQGVFSYCTNLTEINVDDNNLNYTDIDGVLFSKDKTNLVSYPAGKKDTTYSIPNSVTAIGEVAFSICDSLTSVIIPDSVTIIGKSAFSGCHSLTSVDIPNSITTIGEWAFSGCDSLTSIDIPNSVTSIGKEAFKDCAIDKTLTLYGGAGSAAEVYANADTTDNVEFSSETPISNIIINGKLTNNGDIQINGLGTLQNLGEIDNKGTISVGSKATFLDEGEFSGNAVGIG